jgi:hypothetical protein
VFAVLVCLVILGIYQGAAWLEQQGYPVGFNAAGYLVTATIKVAQVLWNVFSAALIDMEHHRLEKNFFRSWSMKTIIIQMVCSFSSFVYVGFIMKRVDSCPMSYGGCFGYLCYEMVIVFVLYIVFTLWDIFYPLLVLTVRTYCERRAAQKIGQKVQSLSHLELQSKMDEYDSSCQAEDFCEHLLPLSFVLLFGITLPCSPILALLSSFLQLHVDAFKITHSMQRPYPHGAEEGLGIWSEILQHLAFLAVYSNVAIISFLLEPFSSYTVDKQLLWFFGLSTLAQFGRAVISAYMPVESPEVAIAVNRQRRQMDAVKDLQKHYTASLFSEKPTNHRRVISPQDLFKNAAEAKQPVALAVQADVDFSIVPRCANKFYIASAC